MSRRELLGRAAGLAVAGASLTAASPPRAHGAVLGPRLRKCLSLGGFAPLTIPDGHPNDYRRHGNREFIRDMSATRWVKLWVSWNHLQDSFEPASREESWAQLAGAPKGERALARLDRQVRAINDDALRVGGMGVILCLYHDFPAWSSRPDAGDPARAGRPELAKLPRDLSPGGPWAWFVSYLLARYRPGAAPNPLGPSPGQLGRIGLPYDAVAGNPLGASIDALEIVNEPNTLLWPQEGIDLRVAEMIVTACELSADLAAAPILGPATSDFPDPPAEGDAGTNWRTFTARVLEALPTPPPAEHVGWSHHNYLDVTRGDVGERSRAQAVVRVLDDAGWRGRGGPRLWLTEGGYNLGRRTQDPDELAAQAERVARSFMATAESPDVFLWTQHVINDVAGNAFKSGLREDFVLGVGPGRPRPVWAAWSGLPGAPA